MLVEILHKVYCGYLFDWTTTYSYRDVRYETFYNNISRSELPWHQNVPPVSIRKAEGYLRKAEGYLRKAEGHLKPI